MKGWREREPIVSKLWNCKASHCITTALIHWWTPLFSLLRWWYSCLQGCPLQLFVNSSDSLFIAYWVPQFFALEALAYYSDLWFHLELYNERQLSVFNRSWLCSVRSYWTWDDSSLNFSWFIFSMPDSASWLNNDDIIFSSLNLKRTRDRNRRGKHVKWGTGIKEIPHEWLPLSLCLGIK